MSSLNLDAEALYADLLSGVRSLMQPASIIVGIWSGGAWLAERLQRDLKRSGEHGVISSALHRDDFGSRGLTAGADHTRLGGAGRRRHALLAQHTPAQPIPRGVRRGPDASVATVFPDVGSGPRSSRGFRVNPKNLTIPANR